MANKHGVAGSPDNHAQHGNPEVRHAHRGLCSIPNAQHVTHSLEECIGILLSPGIVLEQERKRKDGAIFRIVK